MAYLPVIIVFVLYFSSIPIAYALFGATILTLPSWMRLLLRIWFSNALLPARSPSRCWQFPSLLWQAQS